MAQFPKRCACGLVHDAASWSRLESVGTVDCSTPGESCWLALANCPCGSTLAIEVSPPVLTQPPTRSTPTNFRVLGVQLPKEKV